MKDNEVGIRLRLQQSTHKKLKVIAEAKLRSLNAQIEYFALKGLEEYEKENGEIVIRNDDE